MPSAPADHDHDSVTLSYDRETELAPSLQDSILRPLFYLFVLLLQSTVLRLLFALALFPLYVARQAIAVLPTTLQRARLLLTLAGRSRLCNLSDTYREVEQSRASEQYAGTFTFPADHVLEWNGSIGWKAERVEVQVCGIKARVVHAKPIRPAQGGQRVVMLHGNPSWGFIWRNIIPQLTAAGHEVFSVDWLGHGASDKPVNASEISFELHMHTLSRVVETFELTDFYIAAHDWGGCVALCSIPSLPPQRNCIGVFLLNSFFPPRPADISLHYYLLYWIWFFSTGICGPLLPDSLVMRFMAPNITATIAAGFSSPFEENPAKSKASINRFSHMVPGLPDGVLQQRESRLWRIVEGLIGPEHLTNISAQAWLARRDIGVRRWWSGGMLDDTDDEKRMRFVAESFSTPARAMVLFGRNDPLLLEFKHVLTDTIKRATLVSGLNGGWIAGAGHYPMEQKPEVVARSLVDFLEG